LKGYKLWRLDPEKTKCFVSRDFVFDETQMTIICRDLEKGKRKVHIEIEPFGDGSNHLEVSNIKALDDVNQPSTSYFRRSRHEEVNFKPTQRFGYVDLINYALTSIGEIKVSKPRTF